MEAQDKAKWKKLSEGDLIRTRRGYFGHVVRDNGELVSVSLSYNNLPGLPLVMLKRSEFEVVRTKLSEFWQGTFRQIKREELREVIKQERALRTEQPSESERVLRKRDNVRDMLKSLTAEDQLALEEFIRAKKS